MEHQRDYEKGKISEANYLGDGTIEANSEYVQHTIACFFDNYSDGVVGAANVEAYARTYDIPDTIYFLQLVMLAQQTKNRLMQEDRSDDKGDTNAGQQESWDRNPGDGR